MAFEFIAVESGIMLTETDFYGTGSGGDVDVKRFFPESKTTTTFTFNNLAITTKELGTFSFSDTAKTSFTLQSSADNSQKTLIFTKLSGEIPRPAILGTWKSGPAYFGDKGVLGYIQWIFTTTGMTRDQTIDTSDNLSEYPIGTTSELQPNFKYFDEEISTGNIRGAYDEVLNDGYFQTSTFKFTDATKKFFTIGTGALKYTKQ